LGGVGRGQVEIEDARSGCSVILNELLVDDATARWVHEAFAFLNEEALGDPFVNDHDGDRWW